MQEEGLVLNPLHPEIINNKIIHLLINNKKKLFDLQRFINNLHFFENPAEIFSCVYLCHARICICQSTIIGKCMLI